MLRRSTRSGNSQQKQQSRAAASSAIVRAVSDKNNAVLDLDSSDLKVPDEQGNIVQAIKNSLDDPIECRRTFWMNVRMSELMVQRMNSLLTWLSEDLKGARKLVQHLLNSDFEPDNALVNSVMTNCVLLPFGKTVREFNSQPMMKETLQILAEEDYREAKRKSMNNLIYKIIQAEFEKKKWIKDKRYTKPKGMMRELKELQKAHLGKGRVPFFDNSFGFVFAGMSSAGVPDNSSMGVHLDDIIDVLYECDNVLHLKRSKLSGRYKKTKMPNAQDSLQNEEIRNCIKRVAKRRHDSLEQTQHIDRESNAKQPSKRKRIASSTAKVLKILDGDEEESTDDDEKLPAVPPGLAPPPPIEKLSGHKEDPSTDIVVDFEVANPSLLSAAVSLAAPELAVFFNGQLPIDQWLMPKKERALFGLSDNVNKEKSERIEVTCQPVTRNEIREELFKAKGDPVLLITKYLHKTDNLVSKEFAMAAMETIGSLPSCLDRTGDGTSTVRGFVKPAVKENTYSKHEMNPLLRYGKERAILCVEATPAEIALLDMVERYQTIVALAINDKMRLIAHLQEDGHMGTWRHVYAESMENHSKLKRKLPMQSNKRRRIGRKDSLELLGPQALGFSADDEYPGITELKGSRKLFYEKIQEQAKVWKDQKLEYRPVGYPSAVGAIAKMGRSDLGPHQDGDDFLITTDYLFPKILYDGSRLPTREELGVTTLAFGVGEAFADIKHSDSDGNVLSNVRTNDNSSHTQFPQLNSGGLLHHSVRVQDDNHSPNHFLRKRSGTASSDKTKQKEKMLPVKKAQRTKQRKVARSKGNKAEPGTRLVITVRHLPNPVDDPDVYASGIQAIDLAPDDLASRNVAIYRDYNQKFVFDVNKKVMRRHEIPNAKPAPEWYYDCGDYFESHGKNDDIMNAFDINNMPLPPAAPSFSNISHSLWQELHHETVNLATVYGNEPPKSFSRNKNLPVRGIRLPEKTIATKLSRADVAMHHKTTSLFLKQRKIITIVNEDGSISDSGQPLFIHGHKGVPFCPGAIYHKDVVKMTVSKRAKQVMNVTERNRLLITQPYKNHVPSIDAMMSLVRKIYMARKAGGETWTEETIKDFRNAYNSTFGKTCGTAGSARPSGATGKTAGSATQQDAHYEIGEGQSYKSSLENQAFAECEDQENAVALFVNLDTWLKPERRIPIYGLEQNAKKKDSKENDVQEAQPEESTNDSDDESHGEFHDIFEELLEEDEDDDPSSKYSNKVLFTGYIFFDTSVSGKRFRLKEIRERFSNMPRYMKKEVYNYSFLRLKAKEFTIRWALDFDAFLQTLDDYFDEDVPTYKTIVVTDDGCPVACPRDKLREAMKQQGVIDQEEQEILNEEFGKLSKRNQVDDDDRETKKDDEPWPEALVDTPDIIMYYEDMVQQAIDAADDENDRDNDGNEDDDGSGSSLDVADDDNSCCDIESSISKFEKALGAKHLESDDCEQDEEAASFNLEYQLYNVQPKELVPVSVAVMAAAAMRFDKDSSTRVVQQGPPPESKNSARTTRAATAQAEETPVDPMTVTQAVPLVTAHSHHLPDPLRERPLPASNSDYDVARCFVRSQVNALLDEMKQVEKPPLETKGAKYLKGVFQVPDFSKRSVAELLGESLFMSMAFRFTGKVPLLSTITEWRKDLHPNDSTKHSKVCLPTTATVQEFCAFLKTRCRKYKHTLSMFITEQHRGSIPKKYNQAKGSKGVDEFSKFLQLFATRESGIATVVQYLQDTGKGKVTREQLRNVLLSAILECSSLQNDKKLNFILHQVMADVESIFPGFAGDVTINSVGLAYGAKFGIGVMTRVKKGRKTMTARLQDIHNDFHEAMIEATEDALSCMGYERKHQDREGDADGAVLIVSVMTGREFSYTDTEHVSCKVYICIIHSHSTRTISDQPYCHNPHSWPLPGDYSWTTSLEPFFKKIRDSFVKLNAATEGKYLEDHYPPQLHYYKSFYIR